MKARLEGKLTTSREADAARRDSFPGECALSGRSSDWTGGDEGSFCQCSDLFVHAAVGTHIGFAQAVGQHKVYQGDPSWDPCGGHFLVPASCFFLCSLSTHKSSITITNVRPQRNSEWPLHPHDVTYGSEGRVVQRVGAPASSGDDSDDGSEGLVWGDGVDAGHE